jgi:hemerythrin
MVLEWKDSFAVGHDAVDHEHKKLFALAKEITLCENDKEKTLNAVKELIKYTKFHFANEEIYMESVNFIYLEEHKKLHQNLVDGINTLIKNIKTLSQEEIISNLEIIINKNIVPHILTEDKRVHHYRRTRPELKELFCWKNKFLINHYDLDMEHKKLFDIALKALNGNTELNIKEHIKKTIIELYDYMKFHFKHEEAYMQSVNYQNYEEHKILHEDIITEFNDFIKKLPSLTIEEFERQLIAYMDIWLINHIIIEDQKLMDSQT